MRGVFRRVAVAAIIVALSLPVVAAVRDRDTDETLFGRIKHFIVRIYDQLGTPPPSPG